MRKFFRRLIFCWWPWPFYGHRFEIIEQYDAATRKLVCEDCGKYFAMSDRHQAILPWDADYERIIVNTYGIPRSKV